MASPAGTSSPFTTASTPPGTFGPRRRPGAKAVLATDVTPGTFSSDARVAASAASGPGRTRTSAFVPASFSKSSPR